MGETLNVNLGERSYTIHFGADLVADVRAAVDQLVDAGRRVAVVTDENVARTQAAMLTSMFHGAPTLSLAAGEAAKSLAGLGQVFDFLATHQIDRKGALFAAGGGVVGDLAGFAAAA